MRKREFTSAVQQLADDAGLRRVASRARPGTTWVGICSGIMVVMNLDAVRLHVELTSPERDLDPDSPAGDEDDIEAPDDEGVDGASESDEFGDFRRLNAAGIPSHWLEQNSGEPWGFQLVIDDQRRRELEPETLRKVLECVVEDLHDLGAESSQPCCECPRDATTLGYFENLSTGPFVTPYCRDCWDSIRQTTRGVIRIGEPRHAGRGWAFLLIATMIFAAVWGGAQHPALGIPLPLLLFGCAGAGIAMAVATSSIAEGSSLSLRLGVVAGVMVATLAGNMVGVKFLMQAEGVEFPWSQLIPFYVRGYFPAHRGQELTLLVCGVVGVAIGFYLMRETERLRVQ